MQYTVLNCCWDYVKEMVIQYFSTNLLTAASQMTMELHITKNVHTQVLSPFFFFFCSHDLDQNYKYTHTDKATLM